MLTAASSAAVDSQSTGNTPSMKPAEAQKLLAHIRPRAKKGRAKAQYNLGVMYANGYGVKQNWTKARHWYRKAASQHQAKAEQNLGVMYNRGQGVATDQSKAAHWFGRAARDGDPAAQNNLAVLYARGEGVAKNLSQAAIWAARAARRGNSEAKNNLPHIANKLPKRYVAVNGTSVRSTPNDQTHVESTLGRGKRVARLSMRGQWTRVLLLDNQRPGWVKSQDLASQKPKPQVAKTASAPSTNQATAKPANHTKPNANSPGTKIHDRNLGHAVSGAAAKRVVGANSVNVHNKPARSALVVFQVNAGRHLTVERAWKGWMLATFPDGRKGWIAGFLLK